MDRFALHTLSCRYSAGRIPRHAALNDIIRRALLAAGIPAQLEPAGLDRGDGKRPDGITIFPYTRGRCLVWDATCVDTFGPSHLTRSAIAAGSAASEAESRKTKKYADLAARFFFQPVAVETSCVLGPSTRDFLRDLGTKVAIAHNDVRERTWLLQRISLAVVRGNAHCVLSSSRSL